MQWTKAAADLESAGLYIYSKSAAAFFHIYTVVAKIIRTLVFSPAKNGFKSVFLSFAVVCQ